MQYHVTFKLGQIVLPVPTGQWVRDPDGWWWELHTAGYTLLPDGTKTDFCEFQPFIRVSQPPWAWEEDFKRPAWARMLRRLIP